MCGWGLQGSFVNFAFLELTFLNYVSLGAACFWHRTSSASLAQTLQPAQFHITVSGQDRGGGGGGTFASLEDFVPSTFIHQPPPPPPPMAIFL